METKDTAVAPEPLTDEQVEQLRESRIKDDKRWRKELDAVLQEIKGSTRNSRERSLTITKIQEAVMWLGMDLKDLGAANPYPNSYNPDNTIVEPTADGLKL